MNPFRRATVAPVEASDGGNQDGGSGKDDR